MIDLIFSKLSVVKNNQTGGDHNLVEVTRRTKYKRRKIKIRKNTVTKN